MSIFRWPPLSCKSTSVFGFSDGARLRWSKSISVPNFAKISQFMAQIYTVTISSFGKRPAAIFDSTFGFDFDLGLTVREHLPLNVVPWDFGDENKPPI